MASYSMPLLKSFSNETENGAAQAAKQFHDVFENSSDTGALYTQR
jgi:hypothetical protein